MARGFSQALHGTQRGVGQTGQPWSVQGPRLFHGLVQHGVGGRSVLQQQSIDPQSQNVPQGARQTSWPGQYPSQHIINADFRPQTAVSQFCAQMPVPRRQSRAKGCTANLSRRGVRGRT